MNEVSEIPGKVFEVDAVMSKQLQELLSLILYLLCSVLLPLVMFI